MKDLDTKLFGSSGMRGLVNEDLTPALATRIGLAVATIIKPKKAIVARDTRVSGSMFENSIVSGLMSGGANVDCVGVTPTPVLAFLTRQLGSGAGVMITASHNPPQYNGIKLFDSNGTAYDEKRQAEIERMISLRNTIPSDWREIGKSQSIVPDQLYIEWLEKNISLRTKHKIVVDPGCGAAFNVAPTALRKLGCKVNVINGQPDGFFPARDSEPNRQSLASLMRIVEAFGAEVGFAFDGDADRVAFIDANGDFADFDRVLAAYAAYVTEKNAGGKIITNVEASMCIEKMVESHGGQVVRVKVGDVHISEAMKLHGAIFGGEACGAWIHPQFHYCPDGIASSALLLHALEDQGKTLAELVSETPKYSTLRENVSVTNAEKYRVVMRAAEKTKLAFPQYKKISMVDGFRLMLHNGWILIRASGTEPLVRLTVEGESLKTAREIMQKGIQAVKNSEGRCSC